MINDKKLSHTTGFLHYVVWDYLSSYQEMVYPTVFLWKKFNFFNNRVLDIAALMFLVFLFANSITEIFGYLRRRYHSKSWLHQTIYLAFLPNVIPINVIEMINIAFVLI